jgi:LacI family transcriptional regulator
VNDRERRPTLSDIARETGLSVAAVSYALRGLQVPEETQTRVREAADRIGYEVNPIARALASGRTDTVGLLCGSLGDSWQQAVAAALVSALPEVGLRAIIVDGGSDPEHQLAEARRMVNQRVDAIIVMPIDPAEKQWRDIADAVAVIALGDALPGAAPAAQIVYDNDFGVRDGLIRLADLGHRHIAVLSPNDVDTPDRPAEDVARQVSRELGIRVGLHTCSYDLDSATDVAKDVLRAPDAPTAFFGLADSMAWGVYAAAAELGLTIPDDLSVIGYDDIPVSRLLRPALTTYRWPMDELVEAVVGRTLKAIEGRGRSRKLVISPAPVPRDSTARPPRSRP